MPATDPVALVKSILSANWTAANTDNVTPSFFSPDDAEKTKAGDVVRVYSGRPATREKMGLTYDFATYSFSVTIDAITPGTSTVTPIAHATKMREEIERIINNNKSDPDAYWHWMYVDGPMDVQAEYRKHFRFFVNVVLERIGGAVPT
jgi:hypothetical protein